MNSKEKSINENKKPMNSDKPVQTSKFASADKLDTVKDKEVNPNT